MEEFAVTGGPVSIGIPMRHNPLHILSAALSPLCVPVPVEVQQPCEESQCYELDAWGQVYPRWYSTCWGYERDVDTPFGQIGTYA